MHSKNDQSEKNVKHTSILEMDKLKSVVFSMNPNSVACPDCMNGYLFKKCWYIINTNLMGIIQYIFSGQIIPEYFSHSCIILLTKVNNPCKLVEFRQATLVVRLFLSY